MVKTYTATLKGLHPTLIEVEIEAIRGTPQLILIGLPSKTVIEAKERITAALINCGIRMKSRRTIVNLAPADLPKHGSGLELAIAVSVLKLSKLVKGNTDEWLFLGELSLNGQIKSIHGALPLCLAAKKMGFKHVVIPQANIDEVSIIKDIKLHPLKHLKQLIDHDFANKKLATLNPINIKKLSTQTNLKKSSIFDHVIGQQHAKRALTIAATGGHNLLMVGPPGVGKSLLAETLTKLLPNLNQDQAIEVTAIHSIIGENQGQLITQPPFRAPHHTITKVGLIGGGRQLKPGEISLAHHGVLFLDELTEFDRATIESIRQPLESGFITHARQSGNATYPSRCLLIAATNPCPCGWYQSQHKACSCTPTKRRQYLSKLSGPLLDRIDLQVWVDLPTATADFKKNLRGKIPQKLSSKHQLPVTNQLIIDQIFQARKMQKIALKKLNKNLNAQMNSSDIRKICDIPNETWHLLKTAQSRLGLSIRGMFSTLRVAQTIAQLDRATTQLTGLTSQPNKSVQIKPEFVAEALQYRNLSQLNT